MLRGIHLKIQLFAAVALLFFISTPPSGAAELPTEEEIKGVQSLCAAGMEQSVSLRANVDTAISNWKRAAGGLEIEAAKRNLGAALSTVRDSKDLAPVFKVYVDCVQDTLKKYLDKGSRATSAKGPRGMTFNIDNVTREGSDVLVQFHVSNETQNDVRLTIFGHGSRYGYGGSMLIANGTEYSAQNIRISGEQRDELIEKRILAGAPLSGIIRFNNIPTSVKTIDVLSIAYSEANLRPSGFVRMHSVALE